MVTIGVYNSADIPCTPTLFELEAEDWHDAVAFVRIWLIYHGVHPCAIDDWTFIIYGRNDNDRSDIHNIVFLDNHHINR